MAFDGRNNETLSQINVTPLVDVMLVLLVIFMVTAPILQQGITVNLPRVRAGALAGEEVQLVVSLAANGRVYLNDTEFAVSDLQEKLRAIVRERPDRRVFLRADAAVPYGDVMKVMSSVRQAGVVRLGMVTEPPAER
jgi:biopolymer transport protein TolR